MKRVPVSNGHREHFVRQGFDAGLRAEETVLYRTPPWPDIVRRVRMPVSAQGRVVLRERFWAPEGLGGDLTVPPLLIRADAGGERGWTSDGDRRGAWSSGVMSLSRRYESTEFRALLQGVVRVIDAVTSHASRSFSIVHELAHILTDEQPV